MNEPFMSADEMQAELVQGIGKQFLEDLIRLLFSTYKGAFDQCRENFPPEEAHDLRPILRRAMIERDLRPLANSHGLKALPVRSQRGKSFHTEVKGKNSILTISAVDGPKSMFRDAAFRKNLASSQYHLFEKREAPQESPLYAVLLHGPMRKQNQPRFAVVAFPNADCKQYIARFSLFSLFPELMEQLTTGATTERVSEPKPGKIKKRVTAQSAS